MWFSMCWLYYIAHIGFMYPIYIYGNMDPINISQSFPVMLAYIPYIWVNYNDLTATSLESWLVRGIIPKLPYFRLVNYYNLPRYMDTSWVVAMSLGDSWSSWGNSHFASSCSTSASCWEIAVKARRSQRFRERCERCEIFGGSNMNIMNDFPSCLVSDVSAVLKIPAGLGWHAKIKRKRQGRALGKPIMLEISSTRIRENEADQKRAKS